MLAFSVNKVKVSFFESIFFTRFMAFRQRKEESSCSSSDQEAESNFSSPQKNQVVFKPRSSKTVSQPVELEQNNAPLVKYVPERPRSRSRERSQEDERPLRRGEQGKTSAEIAKYQQAGFVMSGSRSSRMNAIRALKEAENDPKGTAVQDKLKKEEDIVRHFRDLWKSNSRR